MIAYGSSPILMLPMGPLDLPPLSEMDRVPHRTPQGDILQHWHRGGFAESDLLMGLNKDWNRMLMLTYHMRHRSTTDTIGVLNVQSREIIKMKSLGLNKKYRERDLHMRLDKSLKSIRHY